MKILITIFEYIYEVKYIFPVVQNVIILSRSVLCFDFQDILWRGTKPICNVTVIKGIIIP